ncbi:hypothetical protein [Streptomyces heilongjiangensis]|uniref:Uncharacterized protein n=1 Tax=Streptomyces heilongjiangensis TaxID=945052 RepID=A0ABW1B835_9ACTN|nr:hypothetical protein [Streptomyces heilongjiangensis]MDC2950128.1 hypothetical protein [Streptomyces heilongjiangensis]
MFLLPVIDDDETQNRCWNASLDGRAIHSFLLWVEPHSTAWARRAAAAAGAGAPRTTEPPDPLTRALVGLAGVPGIAVDPAEAGDALLPLPDGPRLAVLHGVPEDGGRLRLAPAAAPDRAAVGDAVRVLDDVGLRYVVDLAVGAVVLGDAAGAAVPGGVCDVARLLPGGSDALARAEALLREGAASWMDQWLRTEEAVGARSGPLSGTDRTWLTGVFADSLAFQLYDRLAARRPADTPDTVARRRGELLDGLRALRPVLPDRIGETVGMGIVAELIGTTYPCWNRRQFAVKSPFDYVREIRPLTDAEKAEHLHRWAAPSAVR